MPIAGISILESVSCSFMETNRNCRRHIGRTAYTSERW